MTDPRLFSLKARLDEQMTWPCYYMFKFIVAREEFHQLQAIFDGKEYTTRDSRHGKYIALTAEMRMENSDQIIAIYDEALKIKSILTL